METALQKLRQETIFCSLIISLLQPSCSESAKRATEPNQPVRLSISSNPLYQTGRKLTSKRHKIVFKENIKRPGPETTGYGRDENSARTQKSRLKILHHGDFRLKFFNKLNEFLCISMEYRNIDHGEHLDV